MVAISGAGMNRLDISSTTHLQSSLLRYIWSSKIGTTVGDVSISIASHIPPTVLLGVCMCFSFPLPSVCVDAKNTDIAGILINFV